MTIRCSTFPSGHRGNSILLMPRWWYADDQQSIVNAYRNAAAYCRTRGLQYMYSTPDDSVALHGRHRYR